MSQGRWDISLRILTGPERSTTPRVCRGPELTVGASPGAGGLPLTGVRGVAPQHCKLTAFDASTVQVSPVGRQPVRLAPYADVNWDDIEPLRAPARMSRGCAIHLGPSAARGVTLEFVECLDLGLRTSEHLSSEGGGEAQPGPHGELDGIMAQARRPRVQDVTPGGLPSWAFGSLMLLLLGGAAAASLLTAILMIEPAEPLPPLRTGEGVLEVGDLFVAPDPVLAQGLEVPFLDFVIAPNRDYAGGLDLPELDPSRPEAWDRRFYEEVVRYVDAHQGTRAFFKRLEEVEDAWAHTVEQLREARMPEVLGAIAMTESCFTATVDSACCARGYWQFMPEFGVRLSEELGPEWGVSSCAYLSSPGDVFTPTMKTPPRNACSRADYVHGGGCDLGDCQRDFRTDLVLSTRAAVHALGEPLADPVLRGSGAAVQIAILSHHAGYDDSRFGVRKRTNLKNAYLAWHESDGQGRPSGHFYGDVMRCKEREPPFSDPRCEAFMLSRTQRYGVKVVGQHLLAVCWYATHHADNPAFAPWRRYVGERGWCSELKLPPPRSVARANSRQVCPR